MTELAIILSGTAFLLALISTIGLIWCISEVQGWKKTKIKMVYTEPPGVAEDPMQEIERLSGWERSMNPNYNAAPIPDIDLAGEEPQ